MATIPVAVDNIMNYQININTNIDTNIDTNEVTTLSGYGTSGTEIVPDDLYRTELSTHRAHVI